MVSCFLFRLCRSQRFPSKYDVRFVITPICVVEVHILFVICNYLHMLVSNTFSISDDVCVINCSMTCMTSGAGITWVHLGFKLCLWCSKSSVLGSALYILLSFCLFFSFWPLHCQSFTLRSLITHFWYSNFSRIVNYNTKYCPTRYKNHISVSFNCWARCIKSAARLYSQSSMFIDDFVIWHQWHH